MASPEQIAESILAEGEDLARAFKFNIDSVRRALDDMESKLRTVKNMPDGELKPLLHKFLMASVEIHEGVLKHYLELVNKG